MTALHHVREELDRFWDRARTALDDLDPEVVDVPATGKVGAVLVLVGDGDDGPTVVLTRRRADMRSHPGQVSFPGGRVDPGETVVEAAVREATEEVGLDPDSIEVVGRGPAMYIPPSRFWIAPVLARWQHPHDLQASPDEVAAILHVPLAQLADPELWRAVPLSAGGATWAWRLDDDLLWGATAFMMAGLLDIVVPDWSGGTSPDDIDVDRHERPWESMPTRVAPMRLTGELPARTMSQVPVVDVDTVRAMDRLADELGWPLQAMAEHAGRGVAHAVRRLLAPEPLAGARITVLAGSGGNGAGGLTAARLLTAAGADVSVLLLRDRVAVAGQRSVLERTGTVVCLLDDVDLDDLDPGTVVVDAMVGIGADPPLRGTAERAAEWLRHHDTRVVSIDLPSGLGGDIGLRGPGITADVTVTVGLPTHGLQPRIVQPYVGDLYLADLGIPPALWKQVGVDVPVDLFADGPLVRLVRDDGTATDAATPDQRAEPRNG